MRFQGWLFAGLVLVLAGCGSERDEPFDPGPGAGEEPGEGDPERISVRKLLDGEQTLLDIDGERQLLVFRDEDEYWLFLDRYTDTLPANEPDFEQGQVALIDLGEREDNNCEYYLSLETVYAEEVDDDAARLVLEYDPVSVDTGVSCPEEDPQIIRPYYFYYIDSRRELVISESVE
ncbi:hypothetical protein [Gilvimarinus algae]|uniref:Uncharacterized protein n=1 Tax=Gilvimarinus algae TaxID=3058037 RepID=A0ABT8TKL7_9GAMM|nr:hypothetical protein [Gilvimarinus sp. SDUM040014]MDO3383186.1 hypothetical protein [Gilvimarinus sp. SDUM040014]